MQNSQIEVDAKTDIVRMGSKKKNLEIIGPVKIQQKDNNKCEYVNRLITLYQNALIKVMLMTHIISSYLNQIKTQILVLKISLVKHLEQQCKITVQVKHVKKHGSTVTKSLSNVEKIERNMVVVKIF